MAETAIHQETTSLSPEAMVSLYTLDLTSVGGLKLYFTNEAKAGKKITYAGQEYLVVPVKISGMTISGSGSLQTPTLTLSNTDGTIQEIINSLGNLEGCQFTRVRTFAKFLDDGDSPDPTAYYGPDVYVIDRKSSDTPEEVEWELSALIDQQGIYVGRTIIRDTCLWRYREWNESSGTFDYTKALCPYTGTKYYDENNEEVDTPSKDVPARNLECCKKRFGENAEFPFGGFPGIVRGL